MRIDIERLEFRVAELSSIVDDMRLQPATAQFSISPAALESLRSEHDRYLGLLCSSVGQFDRLRNDFTNLLAIARDSRWTRCRSFGLVLDELRTLLDNDDVFEDFLVPPLNELLPIVFDKLCFCCHFVGYRPSMLFFARFCPSISISQPTSYRASKMSHLLS